MAYIHRETDIQREARESLQANQPSSQEMRRMENEATQRARASIEKWLCSQNWFVRWLMRPILHGRFRYLFR